MATKKYLDYAGLKRVLAKLLPGARKIWHGTLAEWEALSAAEKAKYDQAEVIDEYTGVPVVVDKVESGNLNPVTSNAVAELFAFEDVSFSKSVAAQSRGYIYIDIPSKTGYTAKLTSLKNLDTPIDLAGIMIYTCLNQNTGKCLVVVHNDIISVQAITGIVTIMYVKN